MLSLTAHSAGVRPSHKACRRTTSGAAPGFVAFAQQVKEGCQQGRRQDGNALLRDDAAGNHREVGVVSREQRVANAVVLAGNDEQRRLEFAGRHRDGEVVHVIVAAGDDARGAFDAGLQQCHSLGTIAADGRRRNAVRAAGVDDGQVDAGGLQMGGEKMSERGVATQDPASGRWPVRLPAVAFPAGRSASR